MKHGLLREDSDIQDNKESLQCEGRHEKSESRPERMTAGIERWLKARMGFDFPKPNPLSPPALGRWQRQL